MVNFKDLEAPKERIVRETINTPNGKVNVYEPTLDEFDAILEIQREDGVRDGETVNFDGVIVVRKLFPLLTDLKLSDISDEEVEAILANPSIHLLAVQNIVSQIVTEVNMMFLQRIKTELLQATALVDQASIISSIPQIMGKEAKRTGDTRTIKNLTAINGGLKAKVEEPATDVKEENLEPKG